MKIIIRLEEGAMAALAIFVISRMNMGLSWWIYVLLFLSPDISFTGFVFGEKTGHAVYNLFHFKAFAIILWTAGMILNMEYMTLAGLMMFAHASFDRLAGFNLRSSKVRVTLKS